MQTIDELLALIRVDNTVPPETKQKALEELRNKWRYVPHTKDPVKLPAKRKSRGADKKTKRRKRLEYYHRRKAQDRDYNLNWDRSLKGQFYKLRRQQHKVNGIPWSLTLSQWCQMWMSCEPILVGQNVYKPAWKCRGRTIKDVRLFRIDRTKGFEITNLEIRYKDKVIYPVTNQ